MPVSINTQNKKKIKKINQLSSNALLTCLQIALAFEGIAHKPHETTAYICSIVASLNTSYKKKVKIKITTF